MHENCVSVLTYQRCQELYHMACKQVRGWDEPEQVFLLPQCVIALVQTQKLTVHANEI